MQGQPAAGRDSCLYSNWRAFIACRPARQGDAGAACPSFVQHVQEPRGGKKPGILGHDHAVRRKPTCPGSLPEDPLWQSRAVGRIKEHEVERRAAPFAESRCILPEKNRLFPGPGQVNVSFDQPARDGAVVHETGEVRAAGDGLKAEGAGSREEIEYPGTCNEIAEPPVGEKVEDPDADPCGCRSQTALEIALADSGESESPEFAGRYLHRWISRTGTKLPEQKFQVRRRVGQDGGISGLAHFEQPLSNHVAPGIVYGVDG